MVNFCFKQWNKLPELISRCWRFEKVEEYVSRALKTRLQILEEAQSLPCRCQGQWLPMARELFEKNGLSLQDWRAAVLRSFKEGRSKGTLICHAGHNGNEGKSLLFEPLELLFGEDFVFKHTHTHTRGSKHVC